MNLIKPVILVILLITPSKLQKSHLFQENFILDKMQYYLTNSNTQIRGTYNRSPNTHSQNKHSQNKYRCYVGETNFPGQISEKFINSKNLQCGLEIKHIKMSCKNGGLENISFILINNSDKRMILKTPSRDNRYYNLKRGSRNRDNSRNRCNFRDRRRSYKINNDEFGDMKKFKIPKMVFIKKIVIGNDSKEFFCYRDQCMDEKISDCDYEKKKMNFITSVKFVLSDNTDLFMKCGESKNYDEKSFSEYQRVTGINYSYHKNFITKLNFYYNTVANLENSNNSNYYDLFKKEKYCKKRKNKKNFQNYTIGPIGNKKGIEFQDLRRYNNWRLSEITVLGGKKILSIQSKFENLFFGNTNQGEKFGNFETENPNEKNIFIIPKKNRITKIVFFIDNLKNLKGFGIFLNNGNDFFGSKEKNGVKFEEKEFLIGEKESVIGVLGNIFEGEIVSLGFLVNVTVKDNLKNFS